MVYLDIYSRAKGVRALSKAEKRRRDYRMASTISSMGDFNTLKDFCGKAVEEYPDDPDFWNFLGIAELNLSERERAKSFFLKAYQLSDCDATYLNNYLASCFSTHSVVSAFRMIEQEFGKMSESSQQQILELLGKMMELELLNVKLLHRWLSRSRVVEFSKFRKLFSFISKSRRRETLAAAL